MTGPDPEVGDEARRNVSTEHLVEFTAVIQVVLSVVLLGAVIYNMVSAGINGFTVGGFEMLIITTKLIFSISGIAFGIILYKGANESQSAYLWGWIAYACLISLSSIALAAGTHGELVQVLVMNVALILSGCGIWFVLQLVREIEVGADEGYYFDPPQMSSTKIGDNEDEQPEQQETHL